VANVGVAGRHNTSRVEQLDARIQTTAINPRSKDGRIQVLTTVRYAAASLQWDLGRRITWDQLPGDVRRIARGWGELFDLVASVVQERPKRTRWMLDLSDVDGQEWTRGAIETMVYSIAHELELTVKIVQRD
jgi:hypothetical protein